MKSKNTIRVLIIILIAVCIPLSSCKEEKTIKKAESNEVEYENYKKISGNLFLHKKLVDVNQNEVVRLNEYSISSLGINEVATKINEETSKFEVEFPDNGRNDELMKAFKVIFNNNAVITGVLKKFNDEVLTLEYKKDNESYEYLGFGNGINTNQENGFSFEEGELGFNSKDSIKIKTNNLLKNIFGNMSFKIEVNGVSKESVLRKIQKDDKIRGKENKPKKDTVNVEDFYYVDVIPTIDGYEVLNNAEIGSADSFFYTRGSSYKLIYTKDGLETLFLSQIAIPKEKIKTIENIKEIDNEVLDKVIEQYKDTFDDSKYFIDEMNIKYVPSSIIAKKDTILIPCFEIKMNVKSKDGNHSQSFYFTCEDGKQLQ